MANEKWKIDPALRFSWRYKVSPAILKMIYRLRFSEILGKKKNRLMSYRAIAIEANNRFKININKRIVRYWILEIEKFRNKKVGRKNS